MALAAATAALVLLAVGGCTAAPAWVTSYKQGLSKAKESGKPEKMLEKIVEIIRGGNFKYVAAQCCGIHRNTLTHWMDKGKEHVRMIEEGVEGGDTLFAELALRVEEAEGEAHAEILGRVLTYDGPGAAAVQLKFLTHRHQKLYQNSSTRIDDDTGKEEKTDAAALLTEALRQFLPTEDKAIDDGGTENS